MCPCFVILLNARHRGFVSKNAIAEKTNYVHIQSVVADIKTAIHASGIFKINMSYDKTKN
jgi:hypothetical protein